QFNSESLHRHIAQSYAFGPLSDGFVQILAAQQTPGDERWFQGTADAVRQNLQIVRETRARHVLILSGDHLYRMDYAPMLDEHLAAGAEITLAALPCSEEEIGAFGCVRADESGRVVAFREKPADAAARAGMRASPALLAARGLGDRPFLA